MEEVKEHPYVLECEEAKPLIVETFKFMYDLDIMNPASGEVCKRRTPIIIKSVSYLTFYLFGFQI